MVILKLFTPRVTTIARISSNLAKVLCGCKFTTSKNCLITNFASFGITKLSNFIELFNALPVETSRSVLASLRGRRKLPVHQQVASHQNRHSETQLRPHLL